MEFPVVLDGTQVGRCELYEEGLYWRVKCETEILSDRVERLYCGTARLGVLEKENNALVLRRRLSRAAYPMLPPKSGVLTLRPVEQPVAWEGYVLDQYLRGFRREDTIVFPYDPNGPCPCEPLICFFSIKDGFWQLPINPLP